MGEGKRGDPELEGIESAGAPRAEEPKRDMGAPTAGKAKGP